MSKEFEKNKHEYRLIIENCRSAKIGDYVGPNFIIDTAKVGDHYETAVAHTLYNDGDWIVVDKCDTASLAEIMHDRWTEYFKSNTPGTILDIYDNVDKSKRESIFGDSEQNPDWELEDYLKKMLNM